MRKNLEKMMLDEEVSIQYYDRKYWLAYREPKEYVVQHHTYASRLIYISVPKKTLLWICYAFLFPDLPNPITPKTFNVSTYKYSNPEVCVSIDGKVKRIGPLTRESCSYPSGCFYCHTYEDISYTKFSLDQSGIHIGTKGPTIEVDAVKKLLRFLVKVKRYTVRKDKENETLSK